MAQCKEELLLRWEVRGPEILQLKSSSDGRGTHHQWIDCGDGFNLFVAEGMPKPCDCCCGRTCGGESGVGCCAKLKGVGTIREESTYGECGVLAQWSAKEH
jgi:hypothetical protein